MDYELMDDREIVKAILARDRDITINYLYKRCYPLFKSIYDKYYSDCDNWAEFVNEIYVYIMVPGKKTGISKLAAFHFNCTLTNWLKIVSENYCRNLYAKKIDIVGNKVGKTDIFNQIEHSLSIDFGNLNKEDLMNVIEQMPNLRYRKIIEHRYVHGRTNEETAELMSMTMANYYNKHKLAKAQFIAALRKEGLV